MQIYGIRLNYFFRFGEINNSVVFDLSPDDSLALSEEKTTLDELYDTLAKDPVSYVKKIKDDNAITNLLSIVGMRDGNIDVSNGMGKSTILEGICYVLYDKVIRKHIYTTKEGNAGTSVATRINNEYHPKMKECFAEIIFEENGKIYRLKRGRRFSKNKKSSSPILEFDCYNDDGSKKSESGHTKGRTEQESLSKVVTMDYDIFVNGLMFGQGDAGKYLFGTDKVKKDMLINILNLDALVVGQLEAVRKEKNAVDKAITILDSKIQAYKDKLRGAKSPSKIKAEIKQYQGSIVGLEKSIVDFDKQIETLLSSDLIKDIEKIKQSIADINNKLEESKSSSREKSLSAEDLLLKINDEGKTLAKTTIPKLKEKLEQTVSKITDIEGKIKAFNKDEYVKKVAKIKKAKEVKPDYEAKLKSLDVDHDNALQKLGLIHGNIDRLKEELAKFNDHLSKGEDFECSYCRSMVSVDHVKTHISECNTRIEVEKDKEAEAQSLHEKLVVDISKLTDRIALLSHIIHDEEAIKQSLEYHESHKKTLSELIEIKSEYKAEQSKCESKLVILRTEREDCIKKISKYKHELDIQTEKLNSDKAAQESDLKDKSDRSQSLLSHIDVLKIKKIESSTRLSEQKQELGSLTNALKNVNEDVAQYKSMMIDVTEKRKELSRWLILEDVHGLDGIQTRIIRKYLPLLNSYIKGYLDILTDGEMTIDMKINDKSKIDMVITGGSSDTFEMLSGGEKMLVRLAVDISLALLSFVRSSQQPELICLDEIFGQLDDKNTGAVFKLLNALSSKFSRVLLISHKPYISDKIKNKIYVNKQSGTYGMSEILKIDV